MSFTPAPSKAYVVTAATVAASITVPASPQIAVLYNAGAVPAFVSFGLTATVPTGSNGGGMPIQAGGTIVVDKGNATTISAITISSTAAVYVTLGHGSLV